MKKKPAIERHLLCMTFRYGVPACGSPINNDLVRGQWGWDGALISDCGAIYGFLPFSPPSSGWAADTGAESAAAAGVEPAAEGATSSSAGSAADLSAGAAASAGTAEGGGGSGAGAGSVAYPPVGTAGHNYTRTMAATCRAALVQGGCDCSCDLGGVPPFYAANLPAAVHSGAVSAAAVDTAAARMFTLMLRLGMLDPMGGQPMLDIPPEVRPASRSFQPQWRQLDFVRTSVRTPHAAYV